MDTNDGEWKISYKQLGLIIGVFVLGVITSWLLGKIGGADETSFSALELIGFVLSVVLSGASIVLAVSAIGLGKFSEQAIIKRSDDSIRLQNEVFAKTTEALQRIESSTGVTEKRIEDIISGRVGDLSQRIAEIATEGSKGNNISKEELEKEIKESIMSSLSEEKIGSRSPTEERERAAARAAERERVSTKAAERRRIEQAYQEFHGRVLKGFANQKDTTFISPPGHGDLDLQGVNFFDSVFLNDGKKIGVLTFRDETEEKILTSTVFSCVRELRNGTVDKAYIVMDRPTDEVERVIAESISALSENVSRNILFLVCNGDVDTVMSTL
ncbi:hypothetical protein [Pseudomonas sediminis]|uniref:Uncharacterized protein n=1 Tax=Pseudomonas sediminis TaxID=1691904 RepID=A0ABX6SCM4_9PSED|nr:hypothetical protein [Pseudomonas sediminis]QNG99175.1 hypothetical protein HNQ25_12665 [Pseudomonas sediminis]